MGQRGHVESPSFSLFSPFVSDRFIFLASFSRTFVTILFLVCPPFFISAIAASTFYGPWMQCKAVSLIFNFQSWNRHLLGLNSSAPGAFNSFLQNIFQLKNLHILREHAIACGCHRSVSNGSRLDPPGAVSENPGFQQ